MQQCLCNGWGPAAVVRTGRKKNRCCWQPDNGLSLILHSICSICKGVFLLKGWQLCLYRMCFPAVLEILTHSASTLTSQTTSHIFRHIIIDHNKNNTLESETVIWGESWGIAQSNNYASFDFTILKDWLKVKVRRLILECRSDFAWIMRSLV